MQKNKKQTENISGRAGESRPQDSRIPEGVSETYVLEAIEQAVSAKAHKFIFGYFDREDLEQQARLLAWVALEKYDTGGIGEDGLPKRPLVNFLCRCLHSRLCNFKRDNLRRDDAPCKICHTGHFCEGSHHCEKYLKWKVLNDRKAACMETFSILESDDKPTGEVPECEMAMETEEFYERIDAHIPAALREDYLRLRGGLTISGDRRRLLENIFRTLITDGIIDVDASAYMNFSSAKRKRSKKSNPCSKLSGD